MKKIYLLFNVTAFYFSFCFSLVLLKCHYLDSIFFDTNTTDCWLVLLILAFKVLIYTSIFNLIFFIYWKENALNVNRSGLFAVFFNLLLNIVVLFSETEIYFMMLPYNFLFLSLYIIFQIKRHNSQNIIENIIVIVGQSIMFYIISLISYIGTDELFFGIPCGSKERAESSERFTHFLFYSLIIFGSICIIHCIISIVLFIKNRNRAVNSGFPGA